MEVFQNAATANPLPPGSSAIRNRRIHYLAGFDPRGARLYHKLYREEAARQAVHLGTALKVGARRRVAPNVSAWRIEGDWNGHRVETDYQFMEWDDLVRKNWVPNRLMPFLKSIPSYWNYFLIDAFKKVRHSSRKAFYTAIYPIGYFVAISVTAAALGVIAGFVVSAYGGNAIFMIAIAVAVACGIMAAGLRIAERIGVLWLLRSSYFTMRWGEGRATVLREVAQKAEEIADHILSAQQKNPADEVLIVAHSSGAMIAVPVIARLLERAGASIDLGKVHLLTLGQCISFLSAMTSAEEFIADLSAITNDSRIAWIDANAGPDWLCFFRVNPLSTSGLPIRTADRPKQITVRVSQMFPQKKYFKIRRNKVRLHFQYLMASENRTNYDYFLITAGPQSFRQYIETY